MQQSLLDESLPMGIDTNRVTKGQIYHMAAIQNYSVDKTTNFQSWGLWFDPAGNGSSAFTQGIGLKGTKTFISI